MSLSSASIHRLLRPDAYPHFVSKLELLETHISWVVLTGDFAYKFKKPCKFDFVDYSTLERRQAFCNKELEYNRLWASKLYLGVVPVYSDEQGRLRVGDDFSNSHIKSSPVEYAVKMKQFPQDAILLQRLADPRLTAEVIDNFGFDLARFHEDSERADERLECVKMIHIREDAIDNIRFLQKELSRDSYLLPLLERLGVWTEKEFALRYDTMQTRLERGYVRRCHGDMHLNNLVQLGDRIAAFDCIEFNEGFQWIDVMSDAAFPVMDFVAQGRADLGWRLLNGYLEGREDWDGMELFRFYAVYRALVRAKVTWLDQSKHISLGTEHVLERETGPWETYIRTAERFAFPSPVRLAFTFGLSGSGKSTKALDYAAERHALRIRSDVERYRISDIDLKYRYSTKSREQVYDRMLDLAHRLLAMQYSVVIDATFLRLAQRKKFERLAASLGLPFDILACQATMAELEYRIEQRTGDVSEATLGVLHRQSEEIEPLTDLELRSVVTS
jgi:aminoglycoside phosphotransferase family enzyme/predicted kinase